MNISQAAQASGLPAKTIRYYEQIELITPASRNANGYRFYDSRALEELRFVHRARDVGFSVDECRQLVELHRDDGRRSAHVKTLVLEKCDQLQQRIGQLNSMVEVLQRMAGQCSGDEGPECAILDELGRDGDEHE